jgi:phytoene dehydrogenase-like protein
MTVQTDRRGTRDRSGRWDAVVVGGGHNGLVAAALLAKEGQRVAVLEARPVVGGAAVTEQPWGPDFKVTALSYVMSLMPDAIVQGLDLARHGYHVYPMGPSYLGLPDGRGLVMDEEGDGRSASVAAFSKRDAAALERWDAWMEGLAAVLGPLLTTVPPKLGSKRPGDLVDQLRVAWRLRGLDVRGASDVSRLFTMSVGDLLREWFETDAVQAMMAVNGVIGAWAGPEEPGTAYVMLHHSIGDVGAGSAVGQWGYPRGGMGAVADALRRAAESFGTVVRTSAPVERVLTSDGRVTGVALVDGHELRTDTVITAVHPQIGFLRHLDAAELPDDFVTALRRWRSRSGTVKVNLALSELPDFVSHPGTGLQAHHTGAIELAHSLEYLETAFQEARTGQAATRPFSDGCIPSVFDRTLCPEGTHVMSLFTQWVPSTWSETPHPEELEAYADRVIDGYDELAPNLKRSIIHRQVIGPYEMEHTYGLVGGNIFHGELSVDQLFHNRPAAGYADYRSPIKGLYQAHSATHGGGGVCGIPGWQAAKAVLADRRRDRWRSPRRRATTTGNR